MNRRTDKHPTPAGLSSDMRGLLQESSETRLHRHAEALLQEKTAYSPERLKSLSPEEQKELFHELRVHQIELELQNEELRQAQQELEVEKARYFDLYDLAPVSYFTVSKKDLITQANLIAATLLGLPRRTLLTRLFSYFVLNEDLSLYYAFCKQLFESNKQQEIELRMLNNEGAQFWAHLDAITAQDEDGAPSLRITLSNITERIRLEQQDKEHLSELAHVTRLGLMGEMASGIAHEVNQPLAAISGYTQASLNLINAESPDLAKLADILAKTQQQALRMGKVIHRMRKFIKSYPEHRSPADANALIRNCIDLCVAELKPNNIDLQLELENNLPSFCVDSIQIEQVLINLIKNGVDVLRSLPAEQPRRLTIRSRLTRNNNIQVEVEDNGSGINEDQKQKILTPFYTTKAEGMGMGLSISRSLIEAHGGTFDFHSAYGKGATFYFTLPIGKKEIST
ncbi:MAG: ATP-binding protein [Methylobacter sp.]|uniref:PAS domain-containing sensor histidine kinase n=1 Tax=Methylobacter sp. TaxID=2051955 RepID=UPI0027313F7F|nr:ATP-binding protein [Methylobacter sp.]MDP1664285.1 ATP-binding protein [Methylobacter sp.]